MTEPDTDPEGHDRTGSELLALAELVEASLPEVTPGGSGTVSWVVGITIHEDRHELSATLLEGHPGYALRGFDAPSDWEALALLATGRALDLTSREAAPAKVVWICRRDGHEASVLRMDRREPQRAVMGPAVDENHGLVADVMRRALGLPTAPCDEPLANLLAVSWLERLLPIAGERPAAMSWVEIAAMHPASGLLIRDTNLEPASPSELASLSADMQRNWTWERIRWAVAAGVVQVPGIEPEHASWFDAGSFARAALGERPELGELLDSVTALVGGEEARSIRSALQGVEQNFI